MAVVSFMTSVLPTSSSEVVAPLPAVMLVNSTASPPPRPFAALGDDDDKEDGDGAERVPVEDDKDGGFGDTEGDGFHDELDDDDDDLDEFDDIDEDDFDDNFDDDIALFA